MKNARATDPITSIIAGERAAKFAGGHYAKIFDSLAGGATLTAGEIAAACSMSVEQVCRRLPEMQRAAMVAVLQHEGHDLVRNGYRVWQALPQ